MIDLSGNSVWDQAVTVIQPRLQNEIFISFYWQTGGCTGVQVYSVQYKEIISEVTHWTLYTEYCSGLKLRTARCLLSLTVIFILLGKFELFWIFYQYWRWNLKPRQFPVVPLQPEIWAKHQDSPTASTFLGFISKTSKCQFETRPEFPNVAKDWFFKV